MVQLLSTGGRHMKTVRSRVSSRSKGEKKIQLVPVEYVREVYI